MTASAPWTERILNERVLYPALALLVVVIVAVMALRPHNYGPAAPFELPRVDDQGMPAAERITFQGLRGRVVLLDFWATWCAPCRAEIPILQRLHARYEGRGLSVVGINVDEGGPRLVPRFRERFGITYPLVYDVGNRASTRYQVQGLPTLVLIDRTGSVRLRHAGMASEERLAQAIERAL